MMSTLSAGVDGWLARRLGQTSKFGAWLDVVVDNLGRGMLWGQLFKVGWLHIIQHVTKIRKALYKVGRLDFVTVTVS